MQEEAYALDCAEAALKSRKDGAVAAGALVNSWKASLGVDKVLFKSIEEAEQATMEALRSVSPEFQYLAYFYVAEFQRNQGLSQGPRVGDLRDIRPEYAQLAHSNPRYLRALRAYRKAAELKPNFAPAYHGLETVHWTMKEWPEVRL